MQDIDIDKKQDLHDMWYVRMIRAESAIQRFIDHGFIREEAINVLQKAKSDIKQHVMKHPD